MKKKLVKFSCPMDCFDACGLEATVENGRVTAVRPDRDHPLTRGKCCGKGLKLLERQYHPERLTRPLRRDGSGWRTASWDEAVRSIADRLKAVLDTHGSLAVLNYADSGYGGLIKTVDEMFFNHMGGVTVPRGSLCWGAGIAAQRIDFGGVKSHHPADVVNARTIILWGRNPLATNMHLIQYLQAARQKGACIILIDPIRSETAAIADRYIRLEPASDGALALAVAWTILTENLADDDFMARHVLGFDRFVEEIDGFTPQWASGVTGVPADTIRWLARRYARQKPATIILGYGMQRYRNGGSNVRCIDALGAITGNIGISGGGVNYADHSINPYIAGEVAESRRFAVSARKFALPRMAEFIQTATDPPIECLFVSKANPMVQVGRISKTRQAWQNVQLKVVFELFMTDTARSADWVLPVTTILEETDIVYSTMFSPYVNFSHQAVDPPPGVLSEYDFFARLARAMDLSTYPFIDKTEFLKRAIAPLTEQFGLTLQDLKQAPFALPVDAVCWKDGRFDTPSGKFELYSEKAARRGAGGLPRFIAPTTGDNAHPLRLITPHWKDSMHSQHFAFTDQLPLVHANAAVLDACGIKGVQTARIVSPQGQLTVRIKPDERIPNGVAMIHQGWWHKSGSVNFLTTDALSDMGEQAAFYECFCRLTPT